MTAKIIDGLTKISEVFDKKLTSRKFPKINLLSQMILELF